MKNNLKEMMGRWETFDRDSRMVIVVDIVAEKIVIRAFDKVDDEQFKVVDCAWDGKSLSFWVYVPSTRHRVFNRMSFGADGKAVLELTLTEKWQRISGTHRKIKTPKTKSKSRKLVK